MREWDQLVENYLRVCTTRGLAEDVVFAKRRELDRWGNWLKRKRPKPRVSEIGAELILEYVQSRTHFHSKATVAGVMSHMRCMGEFLVQEGVWQQNPLRWIRSPKIDPRSKLPRRIPKADLSKLFEQAAKIQDPYRKARSLTILVLLYSTGIRRGEITRLNLSDWKPGDCSLRIDSQKVNLERTIPIPSVVKRYVEEYLPVRQNHLIQEGTQDQGALFVGRLGKRVRRDDISCLVRRLSKAAGISSISLHQFRHSCASDLLEEGVGVPEVQKVLGHATIVTTARYTHIADPYRKKAVSLHPINSILGLPTSTSTPGDTYAHVG